MKLWSEWMKCVIELRLACSRSRSFMWMIVCLMAMTIRSDLYGISSFVRALGLQSYCYDRILDFLHSPALNVELLTQLWVRLVFKIFPHPLLINGRYVLLGDGLKTSKEGKKMPAVKILHQESQNNSKAEYIMGHSCQAVALLVGALESFFAVPLACRIHEGVKFSNGDKRTLIDKMLSMLQSLDITKLYYFVLDAYYANRKMIKGMVKNGQHLVTRVKSNAVAFWPAPKPSYAKRRGRPKIYGNKVLVKSLFKDKSQFKSGLSPIYGEKNVMLLYREVTLLCRAAGVLLLYVLVIHPRRGNIIIASSDITANGLDVITLYGLRYKIELSFKNALHVTGTFVYHFWMKAMVKIARCSGEQYLHRKPASYRTAVKRKISAYHRHIQLGLIAQGLMQYLATSFSETIWKQFGSWLRTIRPGIPPSEQVTAIALKNSLPDFLADIKYYEIYKKFLLERVDFKRSEGACLSICVG